MVGTYMSVMPVWKLPRGNNAITGKEGGIFMQFVHETLSRLTHAPFTPPPSINTHVDASNLQLITNHKLVSITRIYNHINKNVWI